MTNNKLTFLIICLVFVFLLGCSAKYEQEYQFDYTFDEDQQDWISGFADLPIDYDPAIYELDSGLGELPSGLEGFAIYLSGHNRSDDLFMFIKKKIDGLKPDTTYQVFFSIDIASNSPEGMMGIGGSPGESVYVKAGSVNYEPVVIEDSSGWLRMNINKGNQASEGQDMINIGTLANPNIDLNTFTGAEYAIMNLNNQERLFNVTTDSQGRIWVIVGTDSGFEGLTTVYFDSIVVDFSEDK